MLWNVENIILRSAQILYIFVFCAGKISSYLADYKDDSILLDLINLIKQLFAEGEVNIGE